MCVCVDTPPKQQQLGTIVADFVSLPFPPFRSVCCSSRLKTILWSISYYFFFFNIFNSISVEWFNESTVCKHFPSSQQNSNETQKKKNLAENGTTAINKKQMPVRTDLHTNITNKNIIHTIQYVFPFCTKRTNFNVQLKLHWTVY